MNTERMAGLPLEESNDGMRSLRIRLQSEEDTVRLGKTLAEYVPPGTAVALVGTLGAGKTRLVRAVTEALGVPASDVTSPTFTLWQTYPGSRTIHHLDAYRVQDEDEFFELGVEECFTADAITFIEWADRVQASLPAERLEICIDVVAENERDVEITAASPQLAEVVDAISKAYRNRNAT